MQQLVSNDEANIQNIGGLLSEESTMRYRHPATNTAILRGYTFLVVRVGLRYDHHNQMSRIRQQGCESINYYRSTSSDVGSLFGGENRGRDLE